MGITPNHSLFLTVNIVFLGGIKTEAVIDTAASGPVVSSRLGRKLGTFKRASKARISQADGGILKGGKQVVNSSFKFLKALSCLYTTNSSHSFSSIPINDSLDFDFNAEVLDIGQRDMVIGLS